MFIISLVLLIALLLTALLLLIGMVQTDGISVIGAIVLFVLFFVIPSSLHISDLETLSQQERIIEIQTNYAKEVRAELDKLPSYEAALMNADTPAATLTQELVGVQREIRDANSRILNAEMSINKRKRGFTQYVTWFIKEQ